MGLKFKIGILMVMVLVLSSFVSATDFTSGLQDYWNMSDNTTSTTINNVQNATKVLTSARNTNLISTGGKNYGALNMTSANDYATATSYLYKGTDKGTINVWVNPTTLPTTYALRGVIKIWSYNVAEKPEFDYSLSVYCGALIVNSNILLNTSTWQMVTVTHDGATTSLYVNGFLVNSSASTCWFDDAGSSTLTVNGYNGGGSATYRANSTYDELGVWNTSLSASDVSNLYNSGTGCFPNNACFSGGGVSYDFINISGNLPSTLQNFSYSNVSFNASLSNTYTANCSLFINGTLNETKTGYPANPATPVNFSKVMNSGTYTYNIACNQSNDSSQSEITSAITFSVNTTQSAKLLFYNITSSAKTAFSSGEEIFAKLNLTQGFDKHVVNNSVCNITFYNASVESVAPNTNFSTCTTSCDYVSYSTNFTGLVNTSVMYSDVYMKVCSEQNPGGSVDVSAKCGSTTVSQSFTSFPLCSVGTSTIHFNFTNCTSSTWINVSVSANVPNSQRKRITDLHLDRFYYTDVNNATFNATDSLYYLNHQHEYYIYGNYSIYGNCTSASDLGTIAVGNLPPQIFITGVNTSLGFTPLNISSTGIVEYSSSNYLFYSSVTGQGATITEINYSFWNGEGGQIYNTTNSTNIVIRMLVSNFTDFNNTYSFNISAVDDTGNKTVRGVYFNVTDTRTPTQTGLVSAIVDSGANYTFNANFSDEYLWEFNMVCNNAFNTTKTSIGATTYSWTNTTVNITSNVLCIWNLSDGHTLSAIPDLKPVKTVDGFKVGDLSIKVAELGSIKFIKEPDRYSYEITPVKV